MARCVNHECGYHDEAAIEFVDNICPQCNFPQITCPKCGGFQEHGLVCNDCSATVASYSRLADFLDGCLAQAANGKGKERHVGDEVIPFEEQDIVTELKHCGAGAGIFQARKKAKESLVIKKLRGNSAAIAELQGAINYLCAVGISWEDENV